MRIKNIETKSILSIPYDQEDLNGIIYTKEAVLKAYESSLIGTPVQFKDTIIGYIKQSKIISDDTENKIIKVEIIYDVMFGGTNETVMVLDNIVSSYEITSIGYST